MDVENLLTFENGVSHNSYQKKLSTPKLIEVLKISFKTSQTEISFPWDIKPFTELSIIET